MVATHGLNNSGGTERASSLVANGLSEAGYEIVIASLGPCDKPFFYLNKDIKLISLHGGLHPFSYIIYKISNQFYKVRNKLCRIPNSNTANQIRKILKKEHIDTVIAVDTKSINLTLPATIGLPIKHIGWEHFSFNVDFGLKERFIARQLAAQYCDSVVTLTEKDKECWLKKTRHKSQITAIGNPCPFPIQEYTGQNGTKTVLAVGRLSHEKGFDLLLEAWMQVTKTMADWKLKIVGDGVERATLTEFIKTKKLTNSVELVGSTDNVGQYYKQAEIFCLSSRIEGFGMVLTEALAFGLPIVSFDCEIGPAEILEDTGSILVPKNDVNQLALSLIELMKDDEKRKTLSLRGKEKAEIYQPANIINQWVTLLESFK
nr:glycosyltransferase [Psychrobacter sp.]